MPLLIQIPSQVSAYTVYASVVIDKTLLIPLAGVIVGWMLGQVSTLLGVARDNRRYISSALPSLMALYFEKYRIDEILRFYNLQLGKELRKLVDEAATEKNKETIKGVDAAKSACISRFEVVRRTNATLPQKTMDAVTASARDGIKELSKADAASAYKASRILNEFLLFNEIELPDNPGDLLVYVKNWEAILSTFRNDLRDLKRLIFWLRARLLRGRCVALIDAGRLPPPGE